MEAKTILREWVNRNVKPAIVELAESAGHKVVFTPPHFSDLQPIELLWARVKGAVARQYSKNTTMFDVRNRLENEFQLLMCDSGASTIRDIVVHVNGIIQKFQDEIVEQESQDQMSEEGESQRTFTDVSSESDIEF